MPSTFAFYRPRGVPRNYIVEITLEKQPDEDITVFVNHNRPENCGHCGHQHPTQTVSGTGTKSQVTYVIGDKSHPVPMLPGDTITIEVSVQMVVPKQRLVYTATSDGFTCTSQPFKLTNKQVWQPEEIAFQKIAMIDRDRQPSEKQKYPYLPETVIKEQTQRFTRRTGIVDEVRLHEVLTKMDMDEAAKHASEQQVPLVERQLQEILSQA